MLWAIILVISGEALGIFSELYGARVFQNYSSSTITLFLKIFPIMAIGGGLLLAGYMLGYKNFKNIWIVSAVSITSILIIEPVLNLIIFHQAPTRGAAIGLLLGVMGIFAAIFIH